MQKIVFTLFLFLFSFSLGYSQLTTLWEKSLAAGTKPAWDTGNLTRGISYGYVQGQHLLFVANRNSAFGGKMVIYYNAQTGDSLGTLNVSALTGGTYAINDIEVSEDGKIFLGNLTVNAANDPFKVYRYDSLTAEPVLALSYNATAERIGDKITVTGQCSDNSIIIWAPISLTTQGPGNIYKFSSNDNGISFTFTSVTVSNVWYSSAVGPATNGNFYFDSHGRRPSKHSTDGSFLGYMPSSLISGSGSAVRYLTTIAGDEYVLFNELIPNNGKIFRVPDGIIDSSVVFAVAPILGNTSAEGLGDVSARKVSNFIYDIFVLATNNGFGAYRVKITPMLAGDYYIGAPGTGPNGTDPQFASLRETFDVLNDASITADCNFYITSDLTETYGTPFVGLGLAVNPEPFTITFKPYTGVQPVVTLTYPADGNSGPSGALVIGIPSKGNITWDSLRTTKNIVIDGSNAPNGTTRDLTIQSATTSHRNGIPLVVVGDVSNLTVKNTKIYYKTQVVSTSGSLFIGGIMIRSRNYNSIDWSPKDLIFDNNHISANFDGVAQNAQGYGTYHTGTPNVLNYPYNIVLKNNLIEGKRRALGIYRAGSHTIFGNEIILNQTIAAGLTNEAVYFVDCDTNSVFNFYNNKISKLSGITTGAGTGIAAINIEALGTFNIFNNMITGFELTAANPTAYLRGIRSMSSVSTVNYIYNTLVMNDIAATGTGAVTYQGLYLKYGINNLANNIVVTNEDDFASYCIYRDSLFGTVNSDYNDFFAASPVGNVGYWNLTVTPTLAEWRLASAMDQNSVSKLVNFVSEADLHLAAPSEGDQDLIALPVPGITTDFDNELRHANYPYKGADESPVVLPVELTSFSALVSGNNVILSWQTATEINSSYFEVERRSETSVWNAVGKVIAAGTSTEAVDYTFVDQNVSGKIWYRLKQVDIIGSFSYSEEIEVNTFAPTEFSLSQNYPNPFNPTTKINYTVPSDSKVSLTVYSITGEIVAELVNEVKPAGRYTVDFDASGLSSGIYIYRMTAGKFTKISKMSLIK